eukprot:Seg5509.3 transcript_id=Seg5509.3/GoldUCD/mRNA.D3Y31 product="hypothetical protein" protein_id=Seg5509.3/GoldUCD/D3Y31
MADNGFESSDDSSSSTNEETNEDKPMPKQITSLVGNIIVSGASKAKDAVEAGASYIQPNVWPDMDNVDNLVNVLTIAGYAVTTFSVIGTTYFLTRTAREAFQWRSWVKYRHTIRKNRSGSS